MVMLRNAKGVSIIGAILAVLVFSLFAAVAVSLVSTGSSVGLQEELGMRAFYIAEGGLRFTLMNGSAPCSYEITSPKALGGGSFLVNTSCMGPSAGCSSPATVTDSPLLPGSTTINVSSTAGYLIPGTIKMDNEYAFCNTVTATSFTNCTRGTSGSPARAHTAGTEVTQCTVTSTGTYDAGLFFGAATRSVKANVGQ